MSSFFVLIVFAILGIIRYFWKKSRIKEYKENETKIEKEISDYYSSFDQFALDVGDHGRMKELNELYDNDEDERKKMEDEFHRICEENCINKDGSLDSFLKFFSVCTKLAEEGKIPQPNPYSYVPLSSDITGTHYKNTRAFLGPHFHNSYYVKYVSAGDIRRFYKWVSQTINKRYPQYYICRSKACDDMDLKNFKGAYPFGTYVYHWNVQKKVLFNIFIETQRIDYLSDKELGEEFYPGKQYHPFD